MINIIYRKEFDTSDNGIETGDTTYEFIFSFNGTSGGTDCIYTKVKNITDGNWEGQKAYTKPLNNISNQIEISNSANQATVHSVTIYPHFMNADGIQ